MTIVADSPGRRGRRQTPGEEIANSLSHGAGLVATLIAAPVLLLAAFERGDHRFFVGAMVFCLTMIALYCSSMVYHAWPHTHRAKSALQLFDHCAIFLLIAGTYTPFTLGPLRGTVGLVLLGVVWGLAIFGVILKTTRTTFRDSKFSLVLYLTMGWLVLLVIGPVVSHTPGRAIFWLFAGGIAYTSGVLFFVNEQRRYSHFIWHIFVLAGSCCHFLAVLACIR